MFSSQFKSEALVRYNKIFKALQASDADALLLNTNVNIYYAAGQIFSGYIYIDKSGNMLYFVKRPVGLKGEPVVYIRKPEEIPAILQEAEIPLPSRIALELDYTSHNDIVRLSKVFNDAEIANGSAIMRQVRATKTPYEIERLKESATRHEAAYSHIEAMYEEGMTDFELQIEIERRLRMEGCLGIFRVAGPSMEVFMGSLLSGDNADTPSPYDFALGGAGLDPSLPVGCNGTLIRQGSTVMVDLCGNFTGYMTDMSRTFSVGQIPELAHRAHATSRAIHEALRAIARPGVAASEMYNTAYEMAAKAGLSDYFMGYTQHAGFIGHGVGIEINESPVLAPRSRDILAAGNIIAIEPKFVIPDTGAVGVENTYLVTENGMECLTNFKEDIIPLD